LREGHDLGRAAKPLGLCRALAPGVGCARNTIASLRKSEPQWLKPRLAAPVRHD